MYIRGFFVVDLTRRQSSTKIMPVNLLLTRFSHFKKERFMLRSLKFGIFLIAVLPSSIALAHSFICAEPGGKRLVEIDGNLVTLMTDPEKSRIYIDKNDLLTDPHAEAFLVVDDDDIRPSVAGVKIARFDGDNIRHGPYTDGKVLINYKDRSLCPDFASDRIYSVEGDVPLSKQELVAGLYLLKPDMFKLTDAEIAQQKKDMKEADEAEAAKAAADQVAGDWMMLNSSGIVEKVGKGTITVSPKKGNAYPVTFDFTKGEGPTWNGAGVYKEGGGEKTFFTAYGTPKTVALCVYEINGGTLKGTWYPWYIDGDEKNTGTENLSGPETLDGTYKIDSAKSPTTGKEYAGTVEIKPAAISGANDDAKPYNITWSFGDIKVKGIGIKSGKFLYVASGTGADVNIAKFTINNGSMNSDWFKLGSTEKGSAAAMTK
jgi:hypothetical protein